MDYNIVITSPSVQQTDSLFAKYKATPGNESSEPADFYNFLSTNTPERSIFFADYCSSSYNTKINNTIIHTLSSK